MAIPTRILGTGGLVVSAQGLGCMGMSEFYGPGDESESVATINAALDLGVTLLDTTDMCGASVNEELVGRAIATRRTRSSLPPSSALSGGGHNPSVDSGRCGVRARFVRRLPGPIGCGPHRSLLPAPNRRHGAGGGDSRRHG